MENVHESTKGMAQIFKVLSNIDTIKIFYLAERGIDNSTDAIEMLDLTTKRYYSRLRDLSDTELIRKINGVYRLTALGKIIYDYFIPAMAKACEAKNELTILELLEGTSIENKIKGMFEEEFNLPIFKDSTNVKVLDNYEALAIAAIDLYDSSEDSVFLASNYFDVRVMEAVLRAVDRGVKGRLIVGKKSISSKVKNLKSMLSLTFTKAIINFSKNKIDLKEFVRFVELPYTFGIMDGHHNIINIPNTLNESFIVALSIDDKGVSEKLSNLFEMLWKCGDSQSAFNVLDSISSN